MRSVPSSADGAAARAGAAREAETVARIATWLLALVVVALVLSWAWATFRGGRRAEVSAAARRVVRVQVLNGSGEGGIASKVASYLREGGFQVVEIRNAERNDYFPTMIVARRENPVAALAVAHYLGRPPVIRQAWDSDLADVTVVIGRDRSRIRLEP